MKKIELLPIREWQEKEGDKLLPRIRIYVGSLHIGTAHRCKFQEGDISDKYNFYCFIEALNISEGRKTLEEIKALVESELKTFIGKFLKKYTILKPIKS